MKILFFIVILKLHKKCYEFQKVRSEIV
jgi:hypothetical protein